MTYHDDLPEFQKRKTFEVLPYANRIFTASHDGRNHLVRLVSFPDGHFRAIFHASYFANTTEDPTPSKSQWNTLKKKFKRHNHRVFVFKNVGEVACDDKVAGSKACYYVDFGFYRYD